MDFEKSLRYYAAQKKVETLKGFYEHLVAYILINAGIILVSSNVFGKGETDFSDWKNYTVLFFWGIGLVFHALFVIYMLYFKYTFFQRWEEKKIKDFLEKDRF